MTSLYGHKWTSSYGTEIDPDRVWEAALNGITDEQIKFGLRACVDKSLEWPPSAPEFRNLCVDSENREWRNFEARALETQKYFDSERLRLEDKGKQERRENARNNAMEQIRAKLGLKP